MYMTSLKLLTLVVLLLGMVVMFILYSKQGSSKLIVKRMDRDRTLNFKLLTQGKSLDTPVLNIPGSELKIKSKPQITDRTQYLKLDTPESHIPGDELKIKPKPQITDKYIIFLCDGARICGGWGDRQRGIVSVFLLSLVWKRRFGIKSTTPCDIRASYRPTEDYNWIITDEEVKGKSDKTMYSIDSCKPLNDNFNASDVADIIFIRTNCIGFLDIARKYAEYLPNYLIGTSRAKLFREVWNMIMLPTTRLNAKIDQVLATGKVDPGAKKDLVCAHIRIGRSQYLPHDHVALPLKSVPKIWNFLKQFKSSRIYIATDHGRVRKDAKTRYGSRYIGSFATLMNPDNMRRNLSLACLGQETAYVDQLILTQCDVLLYYEHSGFSLHATYLKNTWTDVFSFAGDVIKPVYLS